jgi:tetratricopeptide (TPR) repeat protein
LNGNRQRQAALATLLLLSVSLNFEAQAKGKRADEPGCPGCLTSAAGLFARGNTLQAADLLRSWKEKCPSNVQLRLLLNTILMRLPNTASEALQVAQEACELAPDSTLAHFQCAMTLLTMGRAPEAAAKFEQVVALDPANYEAWLSLSEIYGGAADSDKARLAQAKAASLSPSTRSARTRTITSLHRAGNSKGVQAEVKRLFGESLEPEFFLGLSDELMNIGYFQEAGQCLERYLDQSKSQQQGSCSAAPGILLNLALCHYLDGNYGQASKVLAPLQKDRPSKGKSASSSAGSEGQALAALLAMQAGDLSGAEKAIEPNSPDKLMQLAAGELAMRQGNYKAAREHFNNSNQEKRLAVSRLRLAEIALKSGDTMDAISSATDLSKINGLRVEALSLAIKGRLRQDELDKDSLQSLVTEITRLTASDGEQSGRAGLAYAHSALALAAMTNDIGRAKQEIDRALAINPNNYEVQLANARINEKLGRPAEAKAALEKALNLAPGDIEGLSQLGLLLSQDNDERAESLLTRACQEGEPGARYTFALARLLEKKGKPAEAAKLFERSLEGGLSGPDMLMARDSLKKCKAQ